MTSGELQSSALMRPASGITKAPGGRIRRGWPFAALLLIFVAGLFVPAVVHSPFYQGLANDGLILGMLALATGFLMSQCNLVMFGVVMFYGGPAYLFAIANTNFDWSTGADVFAACFGTLVGAAAIGAAFVRAKPLPFAMLTLAVSQMLRQAVVITDFRPVTGGEDGLVIDLRDSFLGLTQADLSTPSKFWVVVWIATALVLVVVWAVVHSRFGRILRGIRDNEERMRFSGIGTYWPRLAAFVLAAGIASLAGILHVLNSAFASPELLDFSLAGNVIASVLIGGSAGLLGPVAGGVAFTLGLDQFAASGHLQLFTGVALVGIIAALPNGVEGFVRAALKRMTGNRTTRPNTDDAHADP